MKTTWDELMRYAPEKEYPLPALERGEQERILNKTMKKLEKTKKRPARPVRTALLAAAIAALLCGTAFAAYTNGWFGFDRLFGEKTALIEGISPATTKRRTWTSHSRPTPRKNRP